MFQKYFVHFTCIFSLCLSSAPTPWDMMHLFDDSKSSDGDYANVIDGKDLEVGELYLTVFRTNNLLGLGKIKIDKVPEILSHIIQYDSFENIIA